MTSPRPAVIALMFDGATISLRLPMAALDRFYREAVSGSPRERRALVAELVASHVVRRPSYWWRGMPVVRYRALPLADQDRVAADLLVVIAKARADLVPPPRPTPPHTTTFLPPTRSAPRHHGRS